jgi:outer membrane receptor for ferrienterochelin and colicins
VKHIVVILLSLAALRTTAQEAKVDTAFNLHELVVTGTRTPKLLKDAPVQTRLITAADIRKADATNIQDLLQSEMPGVEFSYAMNQQTHLNFAGFGGQGVLFLVDGERLAGETMDDIDFQRLTMAGVKRIEIVRGASSALYGSNAGGGVINIITQDGGRPWALNVNARLSRHHQQRYGAVFSINRRRISNMLDVSYSGISNYDVKNGPAPQARVFTTVYGDKTLNVKDKFIYRPCDGLKLTARAGYFYRTLKRTPDIPERYRDLSVGLRATWEISRRDNVDVTYSFDEYDKSDYQRLTRRNIRDYSNVQNGIRAVWNHSLGDEAILTAGAAYMHDYLFNRNLDGQKRQQDCADVFAQIDWNVSRRWELVGALRYDYFSDGHHSRLTPKLTARYLANRHLTLRFSYGMGFRAPTLKEKYYNFDMAGIWIVQGNPALKPEMSHNMNISAEWTKGHYNMTATAYYNRVSNKLATGIPYTRFGNDKQLYLDYMNLNNYSIYGAEATLQARWDGGWGARLSYAFTKEHLPKDGNGNTINNQYIPAREHSLTCRLEWDRQLSRHYGLNIALHGRFLSAVSNVEYRDYYNISKGTTTVRYPAYTLWKLSSIQRIGPAVSITLAVDNILNYRPDYYYLNAPITDGASLQAGISIDIDQFF